MSDKGKGLWDEDNNSQGEVDSQGESDSQGEREDSDSPVDDLKEDPTYKYRGQVVPNERKTRHTTKLEQIYPNS